MTGRKVWDSQKVVFGSGQDGEPDTPPAGAPAAGETVRLTDGRTWFVGGTWAAGTEVAGSWEVWCSLTPEDARAWRYGQEFHGMAWVTGAGPGRWKEALGAPRYEPAEMRPRP